MSKLDELLKGIDVEWKTLGEVCEIIRGVRVTKKDLIENGKYPVVSGGTGYMGFVNEYNREENSITIAQYGTAGFVKWQNEKFWANDVAFTIYPINEDILLKRFLYYFLINKQNYLYEISNKIAVPFSISKEKILQIKIPIPPIEIQQEIVRVLDELTTLTNQLTTELETERQNRKKQFEFFREQLFSFEEGSIIFNKLGEIGEFQRGKRFVKTDMISEGVPCIHYGEMYTHYGIWANETKSFLSKELVDTKKLRLAKKNDVIMVAAGETIEDIGKGTSWLSDQGVVFHDACFSFTSPLNPSYVAYFTRTKQFHDQIRRNISSGKISAINSKGLEKVYIPIPSLTEQKRIVKLLDQFDATHTAIEEEITKEIKLRTQQYEYYREKLLSFPSLRTT